MNQLRLAILLSFFVLVGNSASLFGQATPPKEQAGFVATGTAFVVNPDGYLLTCAHVIEDAEKVEVALGGKVYDADVVLSSKQIDVALLKINATNLRPLPLGDDHKMPQAEDVFAFGFPLASKLGAGLKVTRGIVSGDTQYGIQIDAAINPGNSGGPLVNSKGEVVGIITSKLRQDLASNVAFAEGITTAKLLVMVNARVNWSTVAGPKMDGPALFKYVSPSVGLVITTIHSARLGEFRAHEGSVRALAFSPDSRILASGGDNLVKIWDVQTGRLKKVLEGHSEGVTSIAFSPDGKTMVSGSIDRTVRLWDTTTWELKQTLAQHKFYVLAVAFSPDNKTLASGGGDIFDGELILWDAVTGRLRRRLPGGRVKAIAFSPDNETLATSGVSMGLWNYRTSTLRYQLQTTALSSVAFFQDGLLVATGREKPSTVQLWDVRTRTLAREINVDFPVTSVALMSSSRMLAVGSRSLSSTSFSEGGELAVWDGQTGSLKRFRSKSGIVSVSFSPDGRILVTGDAGGNIVFWNATKLM